MAEQYLLLKVTLFFTIGELYACLREDVMVLTAVDTESRMQCKGRFTKVKLWQIKVFIRLSVWLLCILLDQI